MNGAAPTVLAASAGVLFLAFIAFAVVSHREGEKRARTVALLFAVAFSVVLSAAALLPSPVIVVAIIVGAVVAAAVMWFVPVGRRVTLGGRPSERVDERDIMFARSRLLPGTPQFDAYYEMRPENQAGDDRTRALPGLLSPEAEFADEVVFAAAEAAFDLTEALGPEVDGEVAPDRVILEPEEWVRRLREMARLNGAVAFGVTALQSYHVYSHIGRGAGLWGEPITLDHPWAIAFAVEMDHTAVAYAPAAPVTEESARQYVESAKIGVQMAALIRRCGWQARAHIDGNYRVIAPLVARDAGLGEIGRLGLLMTPKFGPRVRLGVVTTDLPLAPNDAGDDASVLDFCTVCRKCADNCPVGAIPSGDRTPIGNGLRWAIDPDICFRYWNVVGTDCGRCMSVCPYSHPDNAVHNVVRWASARSGAARRAALWMDDAIYGRMPKPRDWASKTPHDLEY